MAIITDQDNQARQHIEQAKQRLAELGHKLIEPANQYCEYCGEAMFTSAGTKPCVSKGRLP